MSRPDHGLELRFVAIAKIDESKMLNIVCRCKVGMDLLNVGMTINAVFSPGSIQHTRGEHSHSGQC